MVEHKNEQRSAEWFEARKGKLTGSMYPDLMLGPKARTEWTQGHLTVLRKVAAEIITGESDPSFTSDAMKEGVENEELARHAFQVQTFEEVRECGFFEFNEWIGASPDGIIVRDGEDSKVWEVKCPMSKQHLLYWLDSDELFKKYKGQLWGECLATGLNDYVICSFDPRFDEDRQLVIVEGTFEQTEIDSMKARLDSAIEKIKEWI